MRFATVTAILLLLIFSLVGCSYLAQQIIQAKDVSIAEIDAQCAVVGDPFYQGAADRIWDKRDRKKALTVQQYQDIERFRKFCSQPKESRPMRDYGYWAGGEGQAIVQLIFQGLKLAGVRI